MKMKSLISIILLACLFAAEARLNFPITFDTDNEVLFDDTKAKVEYKLPTTVNPLNYNLQITPHFNKGTAKDFTFDGRVKISFELKADVDSITFHARNLTFTGQSIKLQKANTLIPVNLEKQTKEDIERDFIVIKSVTTGTKLVKGTDYVLTIDYTGILNDDKRGFYRSSYKNDKQQTVWLAATHFEPVGARRAFPCFDEPQYKATFDVTIVHPETYTAISNAEPYPSTSIGGGSSQTVFKTTPKMSTYLLAFVVSDFASKTNDAKKFTVHARSNAIQHADLAVKIGEKLLKALEEYTGIKFEIPKMDQAAIPDFAAGAMENWGLVLYRERSLLYDESDMTTSEKQNIVETIAHEFAHQWFGDLVSPKWWKYLWLNEGFANFFQSFITEKVIPEWRSVDQAVVKSIQSTAFEFDSGRTTHPINQDVESPAEISAIFDNISYSKSGAVIRMIQHFLTEKVFQKGLTAYLNAKKYGAADSDDLFQALQNAATEKDIDVKKFMDSWVNFKGYPVVTVTRSYEKNGKVKIHQERFITYNPDKQEQNNHTWYIPINYATEKNPDFNKTTADLWLNKAEDSISIDVEPGQWLIVNKQQTGFYRVNYDEQNWNLIIKTLTSGKHEKIHLLNRAQLVNDALAFVKQNQLNLSTFLHLTAYLKNETDYVAWYPGYKAFSWLNSKLINTQHYNIFKEHVANTTKSVVESVGFDESKDPKDETAHLIKLNRIAAINLACSVDAKECTKQINNKFEKWINDSAKNPIKPDLKRATLCHGLRTANSDVWNKTLTRYLKSADALEKSELIAALGCSTDKSILQYYLEYAAQDDSPIKDIFAVIRSVSENSDVGINLVLDFVTERFITLYRKIKNENDITNIITSIGQKLTTQEQLDKLKATASKDIHTKFTSKAIEAAENNVKWVKDNSEVLISWTNEFKYNGVSIASASVGLIFTLLLLISTIMS